MHATSCASERNWSLWDDVYAKTRSQLAMDRVYELIFIRHNSRALCRDTAEDDDEVLGQHLAAG